MNFCFWYPWVQVMQACCCSYTVFLSLLQIERCEHSETAPMLHYPTSSLHDKFGHHAYILLKTILVPVFHVLFCSSFIYIPVNFNKCSSCYIIRWLSSYRFYLGAGMSQYEFPYGCSVFWLAIVQVLIDPIFRSFFTKPALFNAAKWCHL